MSAAAEPVVQRMVSRFRERLGAPKNLLLVPAAGRPVAAIGRWAHAGATVDLDGILAPRLLFTVSSG